MEMLKESDCNHHHHHQEDWMILQKSVKGLLFGNWEDKELAAKEIRRIAKKDLKRKKSMAQLGVIQPLVDMVGSDKLARQRLAVQALIELANGSSMNKLIMLESGILSKLPKKTDKLDEPARQDFAHLLLSLSSALSNIQFPSSSATRIIPFVVSILESSNNVDTKKLCLSALHNVSSQIESAGHLATSTGVISTLLRLSSSGENEEASEKALATLGNLVVTSTGRKALEGNPMVPENLIEILAWEEKPKCQELSAYLLMILAHQSSEQREKMAKGGIVPVLLEVALLGSPLAQKRALKLLQWFKDERQKRMGPHSGPQQLGRFSIDQGSPVNKRDEIGKKMMKNIVKQSLHRNMEVITRRASGGDASSKLKSLVISSSSKSLPY
ncbi:OLC1v1021337C1 [Oldenlandia corymbosa var. corymbosa]|uniref:OLC1v1021337C1 n=1 Tax=Oldenlandia corymbosa var. corymbosa TaxID=529605 RepID=A0AAV1BXP6_OLDCO|nr:OLC1v1021337C1 [Oldenlandia corymbosa var. corymbosa]